MSMLDHVKCSKDFPPAQDFQTAPDKLGELCILLSKERHEIEAMTETKSIKDLRVIAREHGVYLPARLTKKDAIKNKIVKELCHSLSFQLFWQGNSWRNCDQWYL